MKTIPAEEIKWIKKILLIQYKPFGDVLLNTGYLPTLRKKFPDVRIDFLIQKPYVTLLEDNPHLNNLVLMNKNKNGTTRYYRERIRIIKKIRNLKYDLVIDQLRNAGSAQIVLFSGAKLKLGWKLKKWNWVYNYQVLRDNLRYSARAKFDLLKPLGITEEPHNTFYKIKDESVTYIKKWLNDNTLLQSRLVIFSPGTPVPAKQWSLDNFAELGDMIQSESDFRLILLWGPGEERDVQYIRDKMKTTPVMAPSTTFNQAGALLQQVDMYIGNDGGINHLAVAMETPSITLFGPKTNPKKWTAWHKDKHMYLRDWNFRDKNDHTFNISPGQVFKKFNDYFRLK